MLLPRRALQGEVVSPGKPCSSADRAGAPPEGGVRPGRPAPAPPPRASLRGRGASRVLADAQADMLSAEASSAICVQRFDDSRTVQVTLRIAFRCVLHRCESQDIRC